MKYSMLLNPGFSFFGLWEIKWYGVIMACSMLAGIILAFYTCKKKGYKTDIIFDLALAILPLAIVGARVYFCIFYGVDSFAEAIAIWNGGMAIYGGVIGGVIGVFIVSRVKKIPFLDLCDIAAPCLILGQCLGRWGNFVNQEAYGYATESLQFFPFSVFIENCNQAVCTCGGSGWHMATFFYESFWNAIGVAVLLIVLNKVKIRGITTASYFIYYGFGRAVIEGMRTDSLMFLGLRVSQWLSILLILLGVALIVLMLYLYKKNPIALTTSPADSKYLLDSISQEKTAVTEKSEKAAETKTQKEIEEPKSKEETKIESKKETDDKKPVSKKTKTNNNKDITPKAETSKEKSKTNTKVKKSAKASEDKIDE